MPLSLVVAVTLEKRNTAILFVLCVCRGKKKKVFSQSYRREDLQKLVVFVCGFVAFTCDELNREIKREQ